MSPWCASPASEQLFARQIKKREVDRKCQREARQKTKTRIAYLEDLTEDLKKSDNHGRLGSLLRQLSDVERGRNALSSKLDAIQKIVGASEATSDGSRGSVPASTTNFSERHSSTPKVIVEGLNQSDFGSNHPSTTQTASAELHPGGPSARDLPCQCACPSSSTKANLWHNANRTLAQGFELGRAISKSEDILSEDTPIRAVIDGWDTVETFSPSWQALRRIEESLFSICGPVERLAILLTMHLLLQFHCQPTPQRFHGLPSWYWARPSQSIAPSYASNYFTWPGLRERFAFFQHRYCSDTFWKLFSPSLHVLWPYEFRDCYMQNNETGFYEFSPKFRERISDLRSWTMGSDFFGQFPELYADIPSFDALPRSLFVPTTSTSKTRKEEEIVAAVAAPIVLPTTKEMINFEAFD